MLIKRLKLGIIGLFAASMTVPVAAPVNALISTTSEESITNLEQEAPLIARYKIRRRGRRRVYIIRKRYPKYRRYRRYRRRPVYRRYRRYRKYGRYPVYRRYRKYRRYRRYRRY